MDRPETFRAGPNLLRRVGGFLGGSKKFWTVLKSLEQIQNFLGGPKSFWPVREASRPPQNKSIVRQACCTAGKLPERWEGVFGLFSGDPVLQRFEHGWKSVVEVRLKLAGHEDVVEEDEDVVDVMGEFPDKADFFPGLAAGPEVRVAD